MKPPWSLISAAIVWAIPSEMRERKITRDSIGGTDWMEGGPVSLWASMGGMWGLEKFFQKSASHHELGRFLKNFSSLHGPSLRSRPIKSGTFSFRIPPDVWVRT